MPGKNKNYILIFCLIICVISAISWGDSLNIPFLNDDIQIIKYYEPETLDDCFSPLFTEDVMSDYWRPVPAALNSLTHYFFGFQPLPYRLINLVIYTLVCLLIIPLALKLGFDKNIAFISALIFSILPAHELLVSWIAGRNDSLMALLILASTILYIVSIEKKSGLIAFFAALLFLLATMTKESAFAGALIPVLLIIINREKFQPSALKGISSGILIVLLVLAYRYCIIGGSPFGTQNYAELSFIAIAQNFVIYIATSFFQADMLQEAAYFIQNNLFRAESLAILIFLASAFFGLIYVFFKNIRKEPKEEKLKLLFAAMWFLLLIAPALPFFGRWYVFAASIGLNLFAVQFLSAAFKNNYRALYGTLVMICPILIYMNINKTQDWINAGERTVEIYKSLQDLNLSDCDTLAIFGAPDKINRVNSMKLGLQQSVQYYVNNPNIEALYPIKSEVSDSSSISIQQSGDTFILYGENLRFLLNGGRSSTVFTDEKLLFENALFLIRVSNSKSQKSKAKITYKVGGFPKTAIYFDGKIFRRMPK